MNLSPEKKIGGVLAPLFALRHDNDLGIGDLEALRQFIDWTSDIGFRLVQMLPINETGGDNSPYNAISSRALEPTTLHLAPGSPAELSEADFTEVTAALDLTKLRRGSVHYRKVKKLKRDLLERAFERFTAAANDSRPRFEQFCEAEREWLDDYTLFRALMERNNNSEAWDQWPAEHESPEHAEQWLRQLSSDEERRFTERREFFAYVQWIAHEQWRDIRRYADDCGVALMG